MDTLTAANLFVGHATGTWLLVLFAWLFLSEVSTVWRRSRRARRRAQRPHVRGVRTAENVSR